MVRMAASQLLEPADPSYAGRSRRAATMGAAAVVIVACAGVAYAAANAHAVAVMALVAGILLCLAILERPLVGAVVIVLLAATMPRDILFAYALPFAGGGIRATDALLLVTVTSWLLARYTEPRRSRLPARSIVWLLIGLLTAAGVGLMTAHDAGTPLKLALFELRPLLMYLLVFVVVADLRDPREFDTVLAILLGGSAFASVEMLVWYVTGSNVGVATFTEDAARVAPSVYLLPMVGLVISVVLLTRPAKPGWSVALWAVAATNGAALFFTFLRGAWLAIALALVFVTFLSLPRQRRRLLAVTAALLLTAAVLVVSVNAASRVGAASPIASAIQRIVSLSTPSADPSAQHRWAEWRQSFVVTEAQPVFGIGLGGTISFSSPLYSPESGLAGDTFTTSYIHNSYIWAMVKLGLPGLVLLVALFSATLADGLRSYYATPVVPMKRTLLALAASLVALMALALTGPHLTTDAATALAAMLIGLIAVAPSLQPWRRTRPGHRGDRGALAPAVPGDHARSNAAAPRAARDPG